MKRSLACLLMLYSLSSAEDVVPAPDYKALYEAACKRVNEANAVAAQWKAKAQILEVEASAFLTQMKDQDVKMEILRSQIASPYSHEPLYRSVSAAAAPLTPSVPQPISSAIRADAERRHPNDFRTQNYVIESQKEAYRKLHP